MSDGKIFISYRRADSAYAAGRLYDRLSTRFGEEHVFMDVEHLDPGVNFVEAINKAVSECDVLIALIGPQWLNAQDDNGKRRLDNTLDFVRLEISIALKRQVRVIPILLQGARPPQSNQLPPNLQPMAQLNAIKIRHEHFNSDADRLGRAIVDYRKEDAERREREAAEKAAREQTEREQQTQEMAQQEAKIADCLVKAATALEQKDWQTAQSNYRQVLKLRPDHNAAQKGMQAASQNLEFARLYGRAVLQQDEGHFESALRTLQHIQDKDTDYRDVPALITAIETLIAEQTQKTSKSEALITEPKHETPAPAKKAIPHQSPGQSNAGASRKTLRRVLLSGGCLGLIIIV